MGTNNSTRRDTDVVLSQDNVNFDHFQILRAIGKGSFGKVCIVQKHDSKKMYAMKYMNKTMCIEKDSVKNVLREVAILRDLEFPFLVNLWFTFQDEEDMFMVVDLLLGGDLRYHLQAGVRFSKHSIKVYLCEIALTLDYLRSKNIIHRDLKPDNLLFDEEGHIHLTDFNVASIIEDGQLSTSVCGTKPYMAPEVFLTGLEECPGYSYPVDWWSLGIVIFEIVAGKRPFDIQGNSNLSECRDAILSVDPPSLSSKFDCGLSDIVDQLICRHPCERLSTLEALSGHPAMVDINWEAVKAKKVRPDFNPPKDHLNCDPTFELEEMIIESKPLHKKKKRLAKKNKQSPKQGEEEGEILKAMQELETDFVQYNRERLDIPENNNSQPVLEDTLPTAAD